MSSNTLFPTLGKDKQIGWTEERKTHALLCALYIVLWPVAREPITYTNKEKIEIVKAVCFVLFVFLVKNTFMNLIGQMRTSFFYANSFN